MSWRRYHEAGVRHIVALRGDPTTGIGTAYHTAPPTATRPRADLVASIKKRYPDIDVIGLRLSGEASRERRRSMPTSIR